MSKNCKYCSKQKSFEEEANEPLIDKSLKNEVDVILEIDRNKLVLWTFNSEYYNEWFELREQLTTKKINYCPMCGKKL